MVPLREVFGGSLARAFAEGGPEGGFGAVYEARAAQLAMAEAVARAFAEDKVLLAEAGTGTGKTLAYLAPAILSGRRVVVSTATRALQDQIWDKDLPLLRRVLAEHGVEFRAARVKGLSNYVCQRRLAEATAHVDEHDPKKRKLLRVLQWAEASESGDFAEQGDLAEDAEERALTSSGSDVRVGAGCDYYESCFITRMRREAEAATLIVTNHHVFFADLAIRQMRGAYASVLPAYDSVVFDEAHHVEDVATEFFGARLTLGKVLDLAGDARRQLHAEKRLDQASDALLGALDSTSRDFFGALPRPVDDGEKRLLFADDLTIHLAEHVTALRTSLSALALVLDGEGSARPILARRAQNLASDLAAVILAIRSAPKPSPGRGSTPPPDAYDEVPDEDEPEPLHAAWVSARARKGRPNEGAISIGASPIDVAPLLREMIFDRVPSVVCTSATLTTHGGFHFARARLGVPPGAEELAVPSPFDVASRAGLYLCKDLPEPGAPGYGEALAKRVAELVRLTGGGAFVLTTSVRQMRALHRELQREIGGPLFVQGEMEKSLLLDRFRAVGNGTLVATSSFWEGVDVPGHALRLVILEKIPFAVPTDPIYQARTRRIERGGGNAFAEYAVPQAAIALKQGFGRLLRTATDFGIVALLDRRVLTRGYGKLLLRSLPDATRLASLEEAREFYGRHVAEQAVPSP